MREICLKSGVVLEKIDIVTQSNQSRFLTNTLLKTRNDDSNDDICTVIRNHIAETSFKFKQVQNLHVLVS